MLYRAEKGQITRCRAAVAAVGIVTAPIVAGAWQRRDARFGPGRLEPADG
jgi:hypothetical protein